MSTGPFIASSEVPSLALAAAGDFHDNFQPEIRGLQNSTIGLALVDLTDGTPQYAANGQHTVEKHVFSLAKIAPLYAAFRLRERLRSQFQGDLAQDADDLVKAVKDAWGPTITKRAPGDFPDLKKIFDFSGDGPGRWQFRFKGFTQAEVTGPEDTATFWKALDDLHNSNEPSIPASIIDRHDFWARMKLMIRMSDNMAAGSVASDVSVAYVQGTMANDGFYSAQEHGLWLSNTYGYNSKSAGVESTKEDDTTAGATAKAVARYFTLLVQKRLVDAWSSDAMLYILKERANAGIGTTSLFTRAGGLPIGRVAFSKLGMPGGAGRNSEGAVVQYPLTTAAGGVVQVKYVAAALMRAGIDLSPEIRALDGYIRKVHA
jgi:hypothetical protein